MGCKLSFLKKESWNSINFNKAEYEFNLKELVDIMDQEENEDDNEKNQKVNLPLLWDPEKSVLSTFFNERESKTPPSLSSSFKILPPIISKVQQHNKH